MRLIERYLFGQLLWPTLAAAAALGGVALLSQTLSYLDILVDQGQTIVVFLKVVLLMMPQLMAMMLPIAVFVAALHALNRLHVEQEIVVCFAAGFSRWRVIAPALRLVALIALATLAVNLWVQPWSARQMREEMFNVKSDVAASLVRPGEFKHGGAGLTVYAQKAEPGGVMHNLFVYREKPDGGSSTLSAREGQVVRRNGEPVLMLKLGLHQEYNSRGVLNSLAFDTYPLALGPFLGPEQDVHYKIADRYLHELLHPDLTQSWEQQNRTRMMAEAHYRLSSPLYNFTFMLLAFWAVIGGPFTRLGYVKRVARAAVAAAAIRIFGFGVQAAADATTWLNVLQYLTPLIPCLFAWRALFRSRLPGVGRFTPLKGPDFVTLAPVR
jgi:lipopolysaccharide export system permease protein